jgi:hypothetical protein
MNSAAMRVNVASAFSIELRKQFSKFQRKAGKDVGAAECLGNIENLLASIGCVDSDDAFFRIDLPY